MKYSLYSDTHIYGVDPIEMPGRWVNHMSEYIYLGDIYDYKNCPTTKLFYCKRDIEILSSYAGDKYVGGNHELKEVEKVRYIEDNILFTHGDYLLWGETKANKFRNKTPGASALKRKSLELLNELRPNNRLLTAGQKEIISQEAIKNNCHTIVIAHKHPSVIQMYKYNDIKIVVVPRGFTEVEL